MARSLGCPDNDPGHSDISPPMTEPARHDSDTAKGTVEEETPQPTKDNPYLHGQLGHRDSNEELKENDSDFPEPGAREEHSGEHK